VAKNRFVATECSPATRELCKFWGNVAGTLPVVIQLGQGDCRPLGVVHVDSSSTKDLIMEVSLVQRIRWWAALRSST
jgi:hypothetical protein